MMTRIHLKEIPEFPNYKVARDGRLFSVKRKRFLKIKDNGFKAYPRYELCKNGKRYFKWCHRIVCELWVAPCEGLNVHHKDGDPLNFHADNLIPLTDKDHREYHRKLRARQMKEHDKELKKNCPF